MPTTNTTDTSEKGLESLIVAALTGRPVSATLTAARDERGAYGGAGYVQGDPHDYDRDYAVDLAKLRAFLEATQPEVAARLHLADDHPTRQKFLARLQGEITRRGVVDVLRKGVKHGPDTIICFYGAPTPGNRKAEALFAANIFSVTRQLRYSKDQTQLALDLCLFINGLPIATFELKNSLTKQTVEDAVEQYKRDRDPREPLFQFGRCVVHFAVDDQEVRMCTHLQGKASWFLPFNKGWNDGAGNPPNPNGLKTAYLWEEVLTRESLTDILEHYAQIVESKDEKTGRKKRDQIFPRYHQLDVVRKLLAAAQQDGVGRRYLIQHSAGSGKSNSIAWLAYQLTGLEKAEGRNEKVEMRKESGVPAPTPYSLFPTPLFDSIIVVTDRRVLDKQIRDTIKQFAQVSSVVGHAEHSGDLREFITAGKKIIITTVQKFPFILDAIGDEHRHRRFAIIIDEAHSSQGGRTAAKMHMALSAQDEPEEEATTEDIINHIMETRKMLPNASYFAFTATPKNKTLEIFGEAYEEAGEVKHRPFHVYTMKQAIQEGFILDVIAHYTPVASYYRLMKTVADDPEFDRKRAQKKLRRYVESHDYALHQKAEIIVEHFHTDVLARNKIGGQARAMVVTPSIQRAIATYFAIKDALAARKSPYQAIVAFSGEPEYGGKPVTEASLNGFPSNQIPEKFKEDPYRFLVVAEKFQTGYDEPLLHTMYVDKVLSGIQAVQTLSRLNRAHPQKHDTFVLDFVNDADTIQRAFAPYYRTTILSQETDPNKLHDLKASLDGAQVYNEAQIEQLVALYLGGASRERLDPILDACVAVYKEDLDEDGQVAFKGNAKAFVRTYNFLASILPYNNADWEKLSIFLNFLIPKLPAPQETDFAKGILEAVDMDSYRAEVQASLSIALEDKDGEIEPVPVGEGGWKPEPEMERLSNILKEFNTLFGGSGAWQDVHRVERTIAEDIPAQVAADPAYQNAIRHSDRQNARVEFEKALGRVMIGLVTDQTELFKLFSDNDSFKKWLSDAVFGLTYQPPGQLGQSNAL
ncbi:MAG TPA: type I restriction endonuclease subunit R [Anaerolineae bacterium]|nr:type I restriction endonuclease subunit R [Anaerolineae bacterium]HQK13337.1 type I restriction endonuclease subunit R [Anaerolineae bacterium]